MKFAGIKLPKLTTHALWDELIGSLQKLALSNGKNLASDQSTKRVAAAQEVLATITKIESQSGASDQVSDRTRQLQKEFYDIDNIDGGLPSDTLLGALASHARKITASIMAEERQKSSSIWTKTLKIFAIVSFVLLYVIYDASGKIYNTGVVEVWATGDELYSHETKQQATIKLDGNWHQLEINVVGNSLAVLRIYPVQNGEMAKFVEISDVRIGDYTVDLTTEQERIFWATIEQPIEMRAGNILRLPELTDDPWVEGHFKNNESTEKVLFKMRVVPEDITFFDWVMVGQFLSAHHAMSWDKLF